MPLVLAVFLAIIATAPLYLPDFYVTLLNYIGLATLVTLGLVLLTGVVGLMSFGQQAFVGLAAYTTAVLTTAWGVSPWLALVAALALTALAALILGFITLRLSGHYLALSTIAWAIAAYYTFGNTQLLGQYNGIANLPRISVFGWILDTNGKSYYLIWAVTLAALIAAQNLLDSRSGRAIRALRFRGVMAESFGVDTAAGRDLGLAVRAFHAPGQPRRVRRQCGHRLPVHGGRWRRDPGLGRGHRRFLADGAQGVAAGQSAQALSAQRPLRDRGVWPVDDGPAAPDSRGTCAGICALASCA